ncbi:Uncharacterized protein C1orf158, partial [Calypte anna]
SATREEGSVCETKNMTGFHKDGQDWWKVEPKYSSKVLIGNWLEDRKTFIKDTGKLGSSIYKPDYICFSYHKPDQILRKTMLVKREGLSRQHFFTHHDEPRNRNLVSEYDDKYNRHGYNPLLPPLRQWSGRKLSWIPQKADFPILEPPTNYGLYEHLMEKWHKKEAGVMNSVYTVSYQRPPTPPVATCQLHQTVTHALPYNQQHFSPDREILRYKEEAIGEMVRETKSRDTSV